MIYTCANGCYNAGQDQLHGPGRRVLNHNPGKALNPERWVCTVCGHVHFNLKDKDKASLPAPKGKKAKA